MIYGKQAVKQYEMVEDPTALMRQYKQTGDLKMRNQLVLHYSKYINAAIHNMRSILLSNIPYEDFFNQGIVALINCIEKYDPDRGASFGTYFYKHIRGVLYNYVREQSWLPNRVREARKKIIAGRADLSQTLQREPTNQELARYLGMSEKKLEQFQYKISLIDTISLEQLMEQAYGNELDKFQASDRSEYEGNVEKEIFDEELRQVLADAIDQLPPKQKQIISLYYYENLNLRETGEILGLTQQRISQLRTKALSKLYTSLKEYMENS